VQSSRKTTKFSENFKKNLDPRVNLICYPLIMWSPRRLFTICGFRLDLLPSLPWIGALWTRSERKFLLISGGSVRLWVRPVWTPPLLLSGIEVVDPTNRLDVCDLFKVSLGGRWVRVPKDDLTHDLHRHPRSGCMGSGVAPTTSPTFLTIALAAS
jgi:hypothetical protein